MQKLEASYVVVMYLYTATVAPLHVASVTCVSPVQSMFVSVHVHMCWQRLSECKQKPEQNVAAG